MSKPLLELNDLYKTMESEILLELEHGRKMTKEEAQTTLVRMRKEGHVKRAVTKVLKAWWR